MEDAHATGVERSGGFDLVLLAGVPGQLLVVVLSEVVAGVTSKVVAETLGRCCSQRGVVAVWFGGGRQVGRPSWVCVGRSSFLVQVGPALASSTVSLMRAVAAHPTLALAME